MSRSAAFVICLVAVAAFSQLALADAVVTFPDPGLQATIREAIGKPTGDILESDLIGITTLHADNRAISNLTGIEHCVNLQELVLWDNQISDLAPLAGLAALSWLALSGNQVSDLAPLSGLTSLTYLNLWDNQISDLAPLSRLVALATLWLYGNQISDPAPLSGPVALTSLILEHNQISDLAPLAELTALTVLSLGSNQISDLAPLAGMTALIGLNLGNNQISDLAPLAGMTALTVLILGNNQISDLAPLVLNTGIGSGDEVDVRWNYLCIGPGSGDDLPHISALLARGVSVEYDPQTCCVGEMLLDEPFDAIADGVWAYVDPTNNTASIVGGQLFIAAKNDLQNGSGVITKQTFPSSTAVRFLFRVPFLDIRNGGQTIVQFKDGDLDTTYHYATGTNSVSLYASKDGNLYLKSSAGHSISLGAYSKSQMSLLEVVFSDETSATLNGTVASIPFSLGDYHIHFGGHIHEAYYDSLLVRALPAGTITGTCSAGAKVCLIRDGRVVATTSASSGTYSFEQRAPGSYEVTASSVGSLSGELVDVSVVDGEVTTVDLAALDPAESREPWHSCAWISRWRWVGGVSDYFSNADVFDRVSPEAYSIGDDSVSLVYWTNGEYQLDPAAAIHALQDTARLNNVSFIPMLGATSYPSPLVVAMLSDPATIEAHADAIRDEVVLNRYDGIDINYEGSFDGTQFTRFVAVLAKKLHACGKMLAITAEPRTSDADNPQFRYADWFLPVEGVECLSEEDCHPDEVRIMCYNKHLNLNAPVSVSEHYHSSPSWVADVALYAITHGIPRDRVILGLPLYGHKDLILEANQVWWEAEPPFAGVQSTLLEHPEAVVYRDVEGIPHFTYEDHVTHETHEIRYEDATSVAEKLKSVNYYLLGGIALWRIGNQDPQVFQTLRVGGGTASVFRVTPRGDVLADGAYYGVRFLSGSADIAEWTTVSELVEPGTVLGLDAVHPGWYRPSRTSCSPLIAGVVSSQPGVILGGTEPADGKVLMAVSGIVPVNVTNEGGPIRPGDLLVSSSTPGYAMRWPGPEPCPCALVGKALEPMTDARGVIAVLLTSH